MLSDVLETLLRGYGPTWVTDRVIVNFPSIPRSIASACFPSTLDCLKHWPKMLFLLGRYRISSENLGQARWNWLQINEEQEPQSLPRTTMPLQ